MALGYGFNRADLLRDTIWQSPPRAARHEQTQLRIGTTTMKTSLRLCFITLGWLFWGSAFALITDAQVTHRAVNSGKWFDASTWDVGVPGVNAIVLVPTGTTVTFAGVVGGTVQAVRVDGLLRFLPCQSSTLVLDTLEVAMSGELRIGTVNAPVQAQAQVRILFRSDRDIDVAWDPELRSRGLLAHGRVQIHGQRKTVHTKVAIDPLAGSTTLQLAEVPIGWQVGDTLVLTGTRYSGWRWDNDIRAVRYFGTRDEVLRITAINGATVTVSTPLVHNHTTPRPDLKASVANLSRNISFATQNGTSVPLHRRGHVMLMDRTDFDVRYAAFEQLGRTNKAVPSFDLDQAGTVTASTNLRGRYPLHIHMSGIEDASKQVMVVGNAVFNSPGWGYAQHASNAVFHNNASFETHGAGFVAETGDEIGSWTNNIAIKAEGNSAFNPKNGVDLQSYDIARTGTGFWFQGRMVRSVGNIAASVNQGYVYLHRGSRARSFPGKVFPMAEALPLSGLSGNNLPPILNFHNNEAFASAIGLYVVKAGPNQNHDIHTHLSQFLAWEVVGGAAMEYTSHYLVEDFDVVGKTPEPFSGPQFGIEFGNNTSDMVVSRARIRNFPKGIRLGKFFTTPFPPEVNQYVVIDPVFENVTELYVDYDPLIDRILSARDLVPGRFEVVLNGGQPITYLSPSTAAGSSGLDFVGSKTDSIGVGPLPAGTDRLRIEVFDMIAITATDGYLRSAQGHPYAVVEEYFTHRATGLIEKRGLVIRLGPDVEALLGNPYYAWRNAVQRGSINLTSAPPIAVSETVVTKPGQEVVIDVLANDSDPDGDRLRIDGFVPPRHGLLFVNEFGSLTYRPDLDFEGSDQFRYWASDGQGNFTPATVTLTVSSTLPF